MSIINRCGWARTYPTDPQAASSDLLSSADPSKSFCQFTCDQNDIFVTNKAESAAEDARSCFQAISGSHLREVMGFLR